MTEAARRLAALCDAVGFSRDRCGRFLLAGRSGRTVRRWLSGDEPIPEPVADWLELLERAELRGDRLTLVIRCPPVRRPGRPPRAAA